MAHLAIGAMGAASPGFDAHAYTIGSSARLLCEFLASLSMHKRHLVDLSPGGQTRGGAGLGLAPKRKRLKV